MIPSFHDGHLTGVTGSPGSATLAITRIDGVRWQIELRGVRLLKVDDFREGNTIDELRIVEASEEARELIESSELPPHEAAPEEYQDKYRRHIDMLVEGVADGSLTLISVAPAYGCELIAICEQMVGGEVC